MITVVAVAGAQVPAVAQEPSSGGATLLVDEAAARAEAEATGEPVVVETLTTENQLVTAVPGVDGLTAEITALPARIRRNDEWLDIDESLQLDAESGRLEPAAVPVSFSVSADGSGPLVEMTSAAGESLSLSWPEELPELPDPVLDGNLATWPGVLPDVDLVVGSYSGGFSTYVVLNTPESATLPELADLGFDMSTEGLTITTDDRGRISATNSSGGVIFKTHLPQQWDAGEPSPGEVLTAEEKVAVDRAKRAAEATMESADTSTDLRDLLDGPAGSRVSTMGLELQPEGASEAARSSRANEESSTGPSAGWSGRGTLRLHPDTEMLTDPSTRFPAVLDPNFDQPDVGSEWAMVWSNGDDWWGEPAGVKPKVGYDGWSSAPKKSRSFYKFEIADLKGTQIQSAIFLHRQIHSPEHTCDTSGAGIEVWTVEAFSSGVSWPGPAKVGYQDTNYKARGHEDYCSTNIENEWNVKPGLVSDLSNGYDRIRLGMYARDETNEMSWRHYSDEGSIYPRLQVVYNRAPNEPSNRSVRNSSSEAGVWYDSKAWVRTHYPRLTATVSDPDGNTSRLHHEIKNSAGSVVVTHESYLYSSPTEVAWTVDKSLSDGTYSWKVWGEDNQGFEGPAYPPMTIVVDTVKPGPPTVEAPKLASYGTGVKLKIDSPAADGVRQYHWGFLTSATPSSKTLDPLSAAYEVTRTGHMGPDWITATASDVAGNVSLAKVAKFKVMGASTSHQWRLDGNGTDVAPSDPAPLALTGSPTFAAGHDAAYNPVGSGSVTWAGNDKALSLNGTSQYAKSSGDAQNLANLSEGFSVSAWVKMDAAGYGRTTVVAAFPDASDNYARARLWLRSNKWNFGVKFVKDGTPTMLDVESSTVTLEQATGRWVHLIGVYEPGDEDGAGAKVRLYVDGEEAASAPAVDPINQNENALSPLIVGAYPNGANPVSGFFDGLIDEARVYSGPLDPTGAYLVSREVRNTSP